MLPKYTLITLYNTMFLPYLNYGLLLWGSCSESIFKLQKRVVRTISISKYNAHTNHIFIHLRLLKLQDLCTLSELKFCHRLEHNMLPIYFYNNIFIKNSETHNYLTRGTNNYQLPVFKHSFIKKSIRYRIPTFNNQYYTKLFKRQNSQSQLQTIFQNY